jgi:hypothetical protein
MFPAMKHDGRSMTRTALPIFAFAAVVALGGATGCSKKGESPSAGASGAAQAPGAPAALGSGAAAVRPRPVAMTADPEQVWAAGASVATGLTPTELDAGRVAVGALSNRGPTVVVFDSKGEGREARIGVKKELTTELKKEEGKREILRVTPALGSGNEVVAFVDYREIGDTRRLVACGPSDSTDEILKFDGKPILDAGDEGADKGKPDEAQKPATPAPSAKPAAPPQKPAAAPPGAKPAPSAGKPAAAAPGSATPGARKPPALTSVPPKPAAPSKSSPKPAAKVPAKTEPERELRECRTIVDRGGAHAWAVGSELVGKPAADGSTDYNVVLFTEQERGRGRADLSTSPLGKAPAKVPVYEAATAYDIGGGSFVLAARFRGALFTWVLDASKHARGSVRVYSGGFPAQPHFVNFGNELALIIVQGGAGQRAARAARFAPDVTTLPSALSDLVIPDRSVEPPVSAAMLGSTTSLASARFVAYQSDESAKRLSIVQVDGNLAAVGEPHTIDVGVRESELFALGDGRLLVVYIRVDGSGKSELVSKTVRLG